MAKVLLVLAALFLITTFGLHTLIISGNRSKRPRYTERPVYMILAWICGLILPVVAWNQLLHIGWGWLLLLNLIVVFFWAPYLGRLVLFLSKNKPKLGKQILTTFSVGMICLLIGTILR
ncbi:MAG: hypothetical protein ACRC9P_01005 [Bacteroides sp.]